jgi:Fe-Mn family superoxide dismutase
MTINRRDLLAAASLGGAAFAFPELRCQGPQGKPGGHEVKPLPFDPTRLPGLSEKLLVSHHDNNYAGAVKNLNRVEADLAGITKDTAGYLVAGLRERELTFRNSATLHELYFGNLGGNGKAPASMTEPLAAAFGSMARFEEPFRATAMSLAGGSGWAVLGYDLHRDGLAMWGSGGHPQQLAATLPLLVLDMYEHAFQMDYGAAAAKYVDAFFANVNWEAVEKRYAAAVKAAKAMRG